MLRAIGVGSIDELYSDIPAELRFTGELHLPPPLAESALRRHVEALKRWQ